MALTPYCGRCHHWMIEMFADIWVCNCTASGQAADTTKDPSCLNPSHDHHDPLSPTVLSNRSIREAEDKADGCICKGGFIDFTGPPCPVHPIVEEEAEEDEAEERPFFEVIDELDEILEDTNRQVDDPCLIAGHNWVRLGTVTAGVDFGVEESEAVSVIDWGPVECLRCKEPAPEVKFALPPPDPELISYVSGIGARKDEPKHACGGCRARDLTLNDAKEHIIKLLGLIELVGILQPGLPRQMGGKSTNDIRREAERWVRMSENKIRAMEGED